MADKKISTFGIVVFPGTNCEYDCYHALCDILKVNARFIWHKEESAENIDAIIIPGGFSYGDYLRSGAVAKFSPVMGFIRDFAESGKLVLGICNGFQILLEVGLLPGAMLRNDTLKFICKYHSLKVEDNKTPFTRSLEKGQILEMPIRHNEGNYYIDDKGLTELIQNGQILLRYCDRNGNVGNNTNPNGSIDSIAGICNVQKNVFGLMPHPEACCEEILGSDDGIGIFRSMIESI